MPKTVPRFSEDLSLRVLCVHPNYELYGSDRSFVAAAEAIASVPNFELRIVLPQHGPIETLLVGLTSQIAFKRLFVLRKVSLLHDVTIGLPGALRAIFSACRELKQADITYVNTCVLVDYLLAGMLTRRPMLVHVREIPDGIALIIIRRLLLLSGAIAIFNSTATKDAFALPDRSRQHVVVNGFMDPGPQAKDRYDGVRPLRVLCIGRLNSWKGQDDLVMACSMLTAEQRRRIEVRIVGGVFANQTHFLDDLKEKIQECDVADVVTIEPFMDDPSDVYQWADVIVAPSQKPEPFGRIAIEAMAYECAVVGTAHGGLAEIIVDGQTGRLVAPESPPDIAAALAAMIETPSLSAAYGVAGRKRFLDMYTDAVSRNQIIAVFEDTLAATPKEQLRYRHA